MFNWRGPIVPPTVDRVAALERARAQTKNDDLARLRKRVCNGIESGSRFVDAKSSTFYDIFVNAVYEVANSEPGIKDFRFHSYARWIDAGFTDAAIVEEGYVQFVLSHD